MTQWLSFDGMYTQSLSRRANRQGPGYMSLVISEVTMGESREAGAPERVRKGDGG